jgi:ubiquinone/menaquinone biosynthesis C-methylase UbiE
MTTLVTAPDFDGCTHRRGVRAASDRAAIGTSQQIVHERLCEAIDLRAGDRVLEMAAGNGEAALVAVRRFAPATSTDFLGALLERGQERAAAARLTVEFREADAEALPFSDGSFDVALSSFGVMFSPDQEAAAREITRVVRHGGRIGLANWTPSGFIGRLLAIFGRHALPLDGVASPALWGTEARLRELFAGHRIEATPRAYAFRYRSPARWIEVVRSWYGPADRGFAPLDEAGQAALEAEVAALLGELNCGGADSLVVPNEYLDVVVTKA